MVKPTGFRVLAASDGSSSAKAAIELVLDFPWPEGSTASGVVAKDLPLEVRRPVLLAALERSSHEIGGELESALRRRWSEATVKVVEWPPVASIVAEAKRVEASVVAVGWRGHGAVKRLLAGSVSRGVVRDAGCSVVVVRRFVPQVRHIVLGFDGSPQARRAVDLVARLQCPPGGRVTLLQAFESTYTPSHAFMHTASAAAAAQVQKIDEERLAGVREQLLDVAQRLKSAGWRTTTRVSRSAPLHALLGAVESRRAHLLVVGARGAGFARKILLGSVAEGALSRSPVPVLIVR